MELVIGFIIGILFRNIISWLRKTFSRPKPTIGEYIKLDVLRKQRDELLF